MNPHRRRGFTLVELLVVIAIIGILVALLLPAIQAAREASRRSQCSNNLKQVGTGLDNYESTFKTYPPGRMGCDGIASGPCNGNPDSQRVGTSGFVAILPFMEQRPLYEQFDFTDGPWHISDSTWLAKNAAAISTRPTVFVCPSDVSQVKIDVSAGGLTVPAATGSYAFVSGSYGPSQGIGDKVKISNNGVFMYKFAFPKSEVLDGLSNTTLAGEIIDAHTNLSTNLWTQAGRHESSLRSTENPINTPPGTGITTSPYGIPLNGAFASRHPAGANFLFGDCGVTFFSENMDLSVYRALSTRSGGESLTYKR